jgi:hypothetical protein
MEEKVLTAKDIPWRYPLCFNNECADKDRCMHYQAWLLTPKDKFSGAAVYPTAWEDGQCRCFQEKKLVKTQDRAEATAGHSREVAMVVCVPSKSDF